MILEYKMVMTVQGMQVPPWVEDGGYFGKPDFSFVGWSPDDDVREYYIPDTVTVLTNEQLIARVVALKNSDTTEEQATARANAWITARS
tara:strand:+ start:510 stop:776 length:267 start_codon:yes stop_codon:yes gene_type:complete